MCDHEHIAGLPLRRSDAGSRRRPYHQAPATVITTPSRSRSSTKSERHMDILTNKVTYLQESSAARPALAARGDDWWTVMAWRGKRNSDNLSAATVNLKNDLEPKRVDKNTSQVTPALTFFRGQWWMAWIGDDGER